MITLVNPKNYPIHVGEGLDGFVIPAFARRSVDIPEKDVPDGVVIVRQPSAPDKKKVSGTAAGGK